MAKGSAGERETSTELSRWWSNGSRSDIFWRTSGSGGRATQRSKVGLKTKYQYGDITFTDPIGKPLCDLMVIENKRGYSDEISVLSFVDKLDRMKDPILLRWYFKLQVEVRRSGRPNGVIIFQRNRRKKCIMMETNLFVQFEQYNGDWMKNIVEILYQEDKSFSIVSFHDFLAWCPPETIPLMLPKRSFNKLIRRKE